MVFPEVRPVRLYSSGVAYAIVKRTFLQTFLPQSGRQYCAKVFTLLPKSGSSCSSFVPSGHDGLARLRLWKFSTKEYKRVVHTLRPPTPGARFILPVLAPEHPSSDWPIFPRVAPSLNPLLQLTFCGTRWRSTGQFRLHLPSLPDCFCACGGVWLD